MEATMVKPHDSPRDFASGSSGVSRSVHQLCIIITEAAEENNHEGNKEVDMQVDKPRNNNKKEKGENSCLNQRVENHHVSHQSWHGSTRKFKERSSDGISIHAAPAQKEVKGGKRHVYEKPRQQ
jgi:hypothetical protein